MNNTQNQRVPYSELPDWYKRSLAEFSDLETKIMALSQFISTPHETYLQLDTEMQLLLEGQLGAMRAYREILRTRLLKIRKENNY